MMDSFTVTFTSSLLKLVKLMVDARIRAEERAKVTHERFNVFTTLLSAHDEVRLHTRFLHCLLDPKGTHDCNTLFLDLFFDTLEELPPLSAAGDPVNWQRMGEAHDWRAEKEASKPEGQLDILLESSACGIAIENKIWAAESKDQLNRYGCYLARRHGIAGQLLYLTIDGKPAVSDGGTPYLRISYNHHILTWLEKCLQATYSFIPINQVLLQYREIVRHITGQTLNSRVMDTITDFIFKHPDIIRHWQQIGIGIAQTKTLFLNRMAEAVIAAAPEGYHARLRPDLGTSSFGHHPNGALVITPPSSSPLNNAPFEIWFEHISKWQALVVGIECNVAKAPLTETERLRLQEMNRLLNEHSQDTGYHKADPHALWDGTDWPTGWHDIIAGLNDQRLADLLDKSMEDIASELWAAITAHIAVLENAYTTTVRSPSLIAKGD